LKLADLHLSRVDEGPDLAPHDVAVVGYIDKSLVLVIDLGWKCRGVVGSIFQTVRLSLPRQGGFEYSGVRGGDRNGKRSQVNI
jgi:hypothetical protein